MGNRLSRIITRTGDDGSTGLGDGSRVSKADQRIEAIGDVDELNSAIGIVLASEVQTAEISEGVKIILTRVQHDLFDLGGELSIPGHIIIHEQHCLRLEEATLSLNHALKPLKEFILPGGHPAAAYTHLARAICRRAERHTVRLEDAVNPFTIQYLNRLSDLLFVMARYINKSHQIDDVLWQSLKLQEQDQE